MSKSKKLSIIIVNYNSKDFLSNCLKELKKVLPVSLRTEVLVLDNASLDDSYAFIKNKYSWISISRSEKNLGFAKANNQLIRQSEGDYILLLNPDTIVSPKALDQMIEYLDAHVDVGAVSPKVVLPSGDLDDACHRGFPTPWNSLCHFIGLSGRFPNSRFFNGYHLGYQNMNDVHEIDSGVGAALMFRREAGKQVKFLDEDYFWYGEDIDFCFNLKQKGWKVVYLPTARILHYKGVTSGIKKHSLSISTATYETKLRATEARFDVMKIFYDKHYSKKYPGILKKLVLTGISFKKWFAIKSL